MGDKMVLEEGLKLTFELKLHKKCNVHLMQTYKLPFICWVPLTPL